MDERDQRLLIDLGELLITLRQEARLTQRQAAAQAESTQAVLSDLENGKRDLKLLTLQRWARVYGHEIEISFVPIVTDAEREFNEQLIFMMNELEDEGSNAQVHQEG